MAGQSTVVADEEQRVALAELAGSQERVTLNGHQRWPVAT